ncbi:hypothetical protein ACFE04_001455 [Oxalis oulophora]
MKIMVAIDDSDVSFYALRWVLNNLSSLTSSTNTDSSSSSSSSSSDESVLTLVHVQSPLLHHVYPVGPGVYASPTIMESTRKAQEENSAALIARAFEICREKMVKAESLIMTGDPKDMICEAVEQGHVQLLVLGCRGLGMIKRAVLGSVSDYCTHYAKSPVLIVKPPTKEMESKKAKTDRGNSNENLCSVCRILSLFLAPSLSSTLPNQRTILSRDEP